ncbi:hypothetical protein RF55_12266 [Lasius niger]|uniref:Uncharacterized protein n=1 Tax=Lasius niger TaxID=67767 RepID=A0A0J7KD47_LASNI|nr:hypothetical protein RF55_12266 [Lasius niger]
MIPAELTVMEEIVEVPEASQAPKEPESERPKEILDETTEGSPDQPREDNSQMTNDSDVAEKTVPEQGEQEQQAAVVLKYRL